MPPKGWKPLLEWTFCGPDYEDHGLPLPRVRDLMTLEGTLQELMKTQGSAKSAYDLAFFSIKEGSTCIEVHYKNNNIQTAMDIVEPIEDAADLITDALMAASEGLSLPFNFPRQALSKLSDLGSTSVNNEHFVEVRRHGKNRVVRITNDSIGRIREQMRQPWFDSIQASFSIVGLMLQQQRCYLQSNDGNGTVELHYSPEWEMMLTKALSQHRQCQVQVLGLGEFSSKTGRLAKIVKVSRIDLVQEEEIKGLHSAENDPILELASLMDPEELKNFPSDFAINIDHYLYGSKKVN